MCPIIYIRLYQSGQMKKIIPFALLLLCAGCGSSPQEHEDDIAVLEAKAKEVIIHSEGGFTDVTLQIASSERKDSAMFYHIESTYKGKAVGFDVTVPDVNGESSFGHGMILASTGAASDNFLEMICELYGIPRAQNSAFRSHDSLTFVDLNKMAEEFGGENASGNSMKIFFEEEGETENDYHVAEVYLNIDPNANTAEFDEKDPEYRSDLIYFLTEKK